MSKVKGLHQKWLKSKEYREDHQALAPEFERVRAELLTAVDAAEASLARGEGRTITESSMRELATEVKQRGRARLSSEKPGR